MQESFKEDPQLDGDERNSGFEIFDEPEHHTAESQPPLIRNANDLKYVPPEQVLKRLLEQVLNRLFKEGHPK